MGFGFLPVGYDIAMSSVQERNVSRITAITRKRQNPLLATVFVNGKAEATLAGDSVSRLGLAVGQRWDDATRDKVQHAAVYEKAHRAALTRLSQRPYTTHKLTGKLRQLKYEDDVVARVIERLTETGLLDDRAYGEALIRTTVARKPAGSRLLRAKLLQHGLSLALADRLVEEAKPQADQAVDQAASLARQKLKTMAPRLDAFARKRRLWGALARRGFDSDTIQSALQRVMSDSEEAGDLWS